MIFSTSQENYLRKVNVVISILELFCCVSLCVRKFVRNDLHI